MTTAQDHLSKPLLSWSELLNPGAGVGSSESITSPQEVEAKAEAAGAQGSEDNVSSGGVSGTGSISSSGVGSAPGTDEVTGLPIEPIKPLSTPANAIPVVVGAGFGSSDAGSQAVENKNQVQAPAGLDPAIFQVWLSKIQQWSKDGSLTAAADEALMLNGPNAKPQSQGLLQSYVSRWAAGEKTHSLPRMLVAL